MSERLITVVEETMQPAHVSLWFRQPGPQAKERSDHRGSILDEEGFCAPSSKQEALFLLLKLGFTYEENLRQRYSFRDRFEDEHYFGLLTEEWHGAV